MSAKRKHFRRRKAVFVRAVIMETTVSDEHWLNEQERTKFAAEVPSARTLSKPTSGRFAM